MTQSRNKTDTTAGNLRGMYVDGRKYTARRTELTAGIKNAVPWKVVAAQFTADPNQVRLAAEFATAVDGITDNCGEDARELLLRGHPRLPAEAVLVS